MNIPNLSLRWKLLVYMTLNIILFAGLLTGALMWLTKPYYEMNKQELLEETVGHVKSLLIQNKIDFTTPIQDDETLDELNRLEQQIQGVINIGFQDGYMVYPSVLAGVNRPELRRNPFFQINEHNQEISPDSLQRPGEVPVVIENQRRIDDVTWLVKLKDAHLQMETLRLQTQWTDGVYLLVWVPMEQIGESVAQTRTWIVWLTIIALIISAVSAYFLAGTLIRPLVAMTRISENMARLDFSESLDVKGNDELAHVSHSINKLSAQLNHTMQMWRQFVSNVSHELKTPIFLIQGYAEGLKDEIIRNPEKRTYYANVIIEETEKMDLLVKDLLQLSQMESGVLPIVLGDVQLPTLVQTILRKLDPLIREKGAIVTYHASELPDVKTDPLRFEQILINFVNNALNHLDEKKTIRITLTLMDGNVRVVVFNSGQPIPDKMLERIWQSFVKVDATRTRAYGGTGLGLAIVRAIQESLDRGFGVQNVDGGVEFWFDV